MTTKELLNQRIERMTTEQLLQMMAYADVIIQSKSSDEYKPENDAFLEGIIEGHADISIQAKSILREEISTTNGWTKKENLSDSNS
jgi:hypothetical protein